MELSKALVECVPNFSEGRDQNKIEKLVDCFRNKEGVKLLNYSSDFDHNRMVVTVVGRPQALKNAVIESIGKAVEIIDLTKHRGEHPRMGAADVVPFIPINNFSMLETVSLAKEVAKEVSTRFDLPVYLYEEAATAVHRRNLAEVRKGEFEGLVEKMNSPLWTPDYGPRSAHFTAGAAIIGARNFLIAWNVNLQSDNLDIAKQIAKTIRFSSGGYPCVKALGLPLPEKGMVQVSMNLTDFTQTGMRTIFDRIQEEATKHGVEIAYSELIGMLPKAALANTSAEYLKIIDFTPDRILENMLPNSF